LDIKKLLISNLDNISQALERLENTHKRFLVAVDQDDNFIGTITDGDIRRALLKGNTLNSPIAVSTNENAVCFQHGVSESDLKKAFLSFKISAITILHAKKFVSIVFEDHLNSIDLSNTIVLIMAGGKGKRLLPLTESVPKPLLPVNGSAIIDRIIWQFSTQGFKQIWISVHHMAEQIVEYLGNGSQFGVDIQYLREKLPLGTAGALSLLPYENSKDILLCNADLFNNIDYRDFLLNHRRSNHLATMGVTRYETKIPYGVVNAEQGIFTSLDEKPIVPYLISAGVNLLKSEVLAMIPKGKAFDIPDLYKELQSKKIPIGVIELNGIWIDIGTHETLEIARNLHLNESSIE
jgi:dTDP-glucose pyrophosphorylase